VVTGKAIVAPTNSLGLQNLEEAINILLPQRRPRTQAFMDGARPYGPRRSHTDRAGRRRSELSFHSPGCLDMSKRGLKVRTPTSASLYVAPGRSSDRPITSTGPRAGPLPRESFLASGSDFLRISSRESKEEDPSDPERGRPSRAHPAPQVAAGGSPDSGGVEWVAAGDRRAGGVVWCVVSPFCCRVHLLRVQVFTRVGKTGVCEAN